MLVLLAYDVSLNDILSTFDKNFISQNDIYKPIRISFYIYDIFCWSLFENK